MGDLTRERGLRSGRYLQLWRACWGNNGFLGSGKCNSAPRNRWEGRFIRRIGSGRSGEEALMATRASRITSVFHHALRTIPAQVSSPRTFRVLTWADISLKSRGNRAYHSHRIFKILILTCSNVFLSKEKPIVTKTSFFKIDVCLQLIKRNVCLQKYICNLFMSFSVSFEE